MKISGHNAPGAQELTTGQARSKELSGDKDARQAGQLQKQGSVKTSTFVLNKIQDRIAAEPDVRADRVAELKAQIKSGDYKIDPQALASKMLTDSLREDV